MSRTKVCRTLVAATRFAAEAVNMSKKLVSRGLNRRGKAVLRMSGRVTAPDGMAGRKHKEGAGGLLAAVQPGMAVRRRAEPLVRSVVRSGEPRARGHSRRASVPIPSVRPHRPDGQEAHMARLHV